MSNSRIRTRCLVFALATLPLAALAQGGWQANPEVVKRTSAEQPKFNYEEARVGSYTLPDLLAASDIVSLHLPLTETTSALLDAEALASVKPTAVIVNTSRGPIIDEKALVDALREGRLAAAGLDVFNVEPVPSDNPLLELDNVVLTPHVTWYTVDTMRRYLAEAVDNCRRLRDGQDLRNVVNSPE